MSQVKAMRLQPCTHVPFGETPDPYKVECDAALADGIVAFLECETDACFRAILAGVLGDLRASALVPHVGVLARSLCDDDECVRRTVLQTLGKLPGSVIAQHSDAVAANLHGTEVCIAALETLSMMHPAELQRHTGAVIMKLQDADACVRAAALRTLRKAYAGYARAESGRGLRDWRMQAWAHAQLREATRTSLDVFKKVHHLNLPSMDRVVLMQICREEGCANVDILRYVLRCKRGAAFLPATPKRCRSGRVFKAALAKAAWANARQARARSSPHPLRTHTLAKAETPVATGRRSRPSAWCGGGCARRGMSRWIER